MTELDRNLREFGRRVDEAVHDTMAYTGNEFQENARKSVSQSVYGRQVYDSAGRPRKRRPWELTGNLLASIGYGLVSNEGRSKKFGDDAPKGKRKGEQVAEKLISQQRGSVLALVAGMPYARAVESKGYDVISNSVNVARDEFKRRIKKTLSILAR